MPDAGGRGTSRSPRLSRSRSRVRPSRRPRPSSTWSPPTTSSSATSPTSSRTPPTSEPSPSCPQRFGFAIEYTDSATNLRYYEPDFVAVGYDGTHYLIETKGREDIDVAHKDRAALIWCENATLLTGTAWRYVKVPQTEFGKLQAGDFAEVEFHVRLCNLSDPSPKPHQNLCLVELLCARNPEPPRQVDRHVELAASAGEACVARA